MMLLLNVLTLSSFTNKVVEVGVINDNTSIENDLVSLGLTPSDYITLKDTTDNNSYDEVYLIAVGENRQVEEYTDVYLYLYNPLLNDIYQDYYFEMKINNYIYSFGYLETEREWSYYEDLYDEPDFLLELCEYDSKHNITKVKFAYSYSENERIYNLDRIERLTDERSFTNPFTATFKERAEDGKLVTDYDYNSFIYITEDVLVPVLLKPEFHWDEVFDFIFSTDKNKMAYFYNFSSSKEIDQILELDILFDTNFKRYQPILSGCCVEGVPGYNEGYASPKYNVERTLYNEKHSYDWNSSHLEFETFKTPAKDRFTDEEFGYLEFTEEQKKQFTDYEHSVLIGLNDVYYHTVNILGASWVDCYHYEEINNLEVKRIKFETDGKIYNSYVADDPDDSTDPILPEEKPNWFDELLDWIKENPLYAVLILLAVIVGLPLIISFLPMILKGIIQLVIGIIKLLFWIIFTPFRIIKSMINKAKEKKKIKQKEAIK